MTASVPIAAQAGWFAPKAWLARIAIPAPAALRDAADRRWFSGCCGSAGNGRIAVGRWRKPSVAAQIAQASAAAAAVADTRATNCSRLRSADIEAPAAKTKISAPGAPNPPVVQVFSDYLGHLIKGFAFSILWAVCVYVLIIYMPIFVQRAFGFTPSQAFTASLIGNVFLAVGCVCAGTVSDRIGRRLMLGASAALMLVAVYPLISWLQASPTLTTLVIVQSLFCIMVSGFVGVAPATLAEVFPTHVRTTGMSLAYNAAVTIFGGFAPATLTWLGSTGIGFHAPAFYVMAAAAASLIAVLVLPKPYSTN